MVNPISFVISDAGLSNYASASGEPGIYFYSILKVLEGLVDVSGYTGTTGRDHYAYVLGLLDSYNVAPYAKLLLVQNVLNSRIQFFNRGN